MASAGTGERSKRLTVLLVRHAESQNNVSLRANGLLSLRQTPTDGNLHKSVLISHPTLASQLRHHDADLSAKGIEQSKRLREDARSSQDPAFVALRAAARSGRLHFVVSPMKRALKTASFLADGLNYRRAEVDPLIFEEGGCYHDVSPWPLLSRQHCS